MTESFNLNRFGTDVLLEACVGLGILSDWSMTDTYGDNDRYNVVPVQGEPMYAIGKPYIRFYAKGILHASMSQDEEEVQRQVVYANKKLNEYT